MMTLIIVDGGGGGGGGVTWNPADKSSDIALSGGDLIATKINSDGVEAVRATTGISSGARYFEVVVDVAGAGSGEFILIGIANSTFPITGGPGQDTDSHGYYQDTGQKYFNNVLSAFGATYKTDGDVIGVAYDATAGKLWWSKNGVWQGSGDPDTGTNEAFSGITGTQYPCVSLYRSSGGVQQQVTGHFAAADLVYSPPTGFVAWE